MDNYTVPETGYCQENDFFPFKADINKTQESVPVIKPGSIVSSIEAVNHNPGEYGVDIRPKVYDNVTKSYVLLDSGSCVSCHPAKPGDIIDPSFKLKSVNGGQIDTYGTKTRPLSNNLAMEPREPMHRVLGNNHTII